ncbi:MAG: hypothetical protein ABWW69_05300 [Pyrodictiaceae archaeon]
MAKRERAITRYKILTETGLLRLLVILYENGEMPLHKLVSYGIGVGAAYRGLKKGLSMGLVKFKECSITKNCIALTEKGVRVARLLSKAVSAIVED